MTIEGKTKRLLPGPDAGTLIMETKDELTGGDAAKKAEIAGIAVHKTTQTANVFQLLQNAGIPVAYLSQQDERRLIVSDCDMLPLELVMRRYAWGSFLKREPSFRQEDGTPFRFDTIRCEFFHKLTAVLPPLVPEAIQMDEGDARNKYLKDGKWAEGTYTDPYIHMEGNQWNLHSAKVPFDAAKPLMETQAIVDEKERNFIQDELMLPCFQTLEKAWNAIETEVGSVALVDIKIEVGRRKTDGKLVISDVIDNDSWRIWPGADPKQQLDKQVFRDGGDLGEVADNYARVAKLSQLFLKNV